jgi:hypothetical protein
MISGLGASNYEDACQKMDYLTKQLENVASVDGRLSGNGVPPKSVSGYNPDEFSSRLKATGELQYTEAAKTLQATLGQLSEGRGADLENALSAYAVSIEETPPQGGDPWDLLAPKVAECMFRDGEKKTNWWGPSIGISRDCGFTLADLLEHMASPAIADKVTKVLGAGVAIILGVSAAALAPAVAIIIGLLKLYAEALKNGIRNLLNQSGSENGIWANRLWISPWVWVSGRS